MVVQIGAIVGGWLVGWEIGGLFGGEPMRWCRVVFGAALIVAAHL